MTALPAAASAQATPAPARAQEVLKGSTEARVTNVLDGDTIRVHARIWLGQEVSANVRLMGIDAPALKGKCAAESKLGAEAKAFVEQQVKGKTVMLSQVQLDRNPGEVQARVATETGQDLASALVKAGHAKEMTGKDRPNWCE
ncbi:MAG: thermonuclease family protein [Alphaproteobacteria bacterium]